MRTRVLNKSIVCFLVLSIIEAGCCVITGCECDSGQGTTRYSVKGFEIRTYSGSALVANRQATTLKDFRVVVDPMVEYLSRINTGFKALYACDPAPPAPTQTLVELEVTSKTDFVLPNKIIKAGESLNELFFLENGANGNGYLPSYLQSTNVDATEFDYVLTIGTLIVEKQFHQFDISITLSGNQKFLLSTTQVELIP